MTSEQKYDCVILGAGVIGLSIACELLGKGLKLAIIARDLPEDVHSAGFASPWAGANWASFAKGSTEEKRDIRTFERFASLAEKYPDLVRRTPTKYVWNEMGYQEPWFKDVVFNYHKLSETEKIPGFKYGIGFEAYTLNPPRYLAHLATKLRSRGVPIIRYRLSSLDEAYSILGPVSIVVNATGLGSRTLLGVEDPLVHPIRGQTVTVRAPTVKTVYGNKDIVFKNPESACYVIPRPGPEGHVTLGGCTNKNDYNTLADPATSKRILQDAFNVCPELAEGGKSWEDIEVVSHNVGLRPAREGGMRLEKEMRRIGQGRNEGLLPAKGKNGKGREVVCVHAYGIGPAGFQASLGIAEEAAELVLTALKNTTQSSKL